MVKRLLCISVVLVFCTSLLHSAVSAGGGGLFSAAIGSTDLSSSPEQGYEAYQASPYLKLSYSSPDIKADMKASYSLQYANGIRAGGLSLDRGYFRFRIPSFSGQKLTVTAGKTPVSWGMGNFYRAGDILLEQPLEYLSAGKASERSIWLVDALQPLGAGFTAEAAFVFPFESSFRAGILVSKDFDSPYFKELRCAYVYQEGGVHKASFVSDLALNFDISLGLESCFRSWSDFRLVVNIMKQYSAYSESFAHQISLYISSQLDFFEMDYDVMSSLGVSLTERVSISFASILQFDSAGYQACTGAVELPVLIADGIAMTASISCSHDTDLSAFSLIGGILLDIGF